MARNADHHQENNQGKGKNLGQGLANISDKDRRDLASGDNAPTKDQAPDSGKAGAKPHCGEGQQHALMRPAQPGGRGGLA